MAVDFEIAQNATNIVTGNQDLDCPDLAGETPKVALHFYSVALTNDVAADELNCGVGAAISTTERFQASANNEHGQGTTDCARVSQTDEAIALFDEGTVNLLGEADHVSFDADKEVINWADAPPAAWLINSLMIAGADITPLEISSLTPNATLGGTVSPGGMADQPNLVFFFGINNTSHPVATFHSNLNIGWAVDDEGTIRQCGLSMHQDTGDGTPTLDQAGHTSAVWCGTSVDSSGAGGRVTNAIELTAFNADGFEVTTRDNTSEPLYMYVALKVTNVKLWAGVVDGPTAVGDWVVTAPGTKPQFAMMALSYETALESMGESALKSAVGLSMFTPDRELCMSIASQFNIATTNTQSLTDTKALNLPTDAGATGYVGTRKTMDTLGFTLDITAQSGATARKWPLLVIGEQVGVPVDWTSGVEI